MQVRRSWVNVVYTVTEEFINPAGPVLLLLSSGLFVMRVVHCGSYEAHFGPGTKLTVLGE